MKKVIIFLLTIFTVLSFISCGSKPAAEETKPDAPVVEEQVKTDDLSSYESIIAKIDDARAAAIEAGAESKAPDQLKKIDDYYASLKDDKAKLQKNADDIVARYKLLENYLKAAAAKDEIDENGFAFYAQKNYDDGVKNLEVVEKAFGNEDLMGDDVFFAAENAYKEFNTVLIVSYKRLAKEERQLAYEAKKKADSVKAGVAQKEKYKAAADTFQAGDSAYSMQNPKSALAHYTEAKEAFLALYEDVAEKRAAAQAAIDEAKKRVAESAKFAEEADVRAPISEKVDGIEDEDTVLLEEDEAPESAEIEIASSIDGNDNFVTETEETVEEAVEESTEEDTEDVGEEA